MTVLRGVIDEVGGAATEQWAADARTRALRLEASPSVLNSIRTFTLSAADCGSLGVLTTAFGRQFVNAVWAADWAAYDNEEDRVDYVRLAFVIDMFPSGFTLFAAEDAAGMIPIGYTGWYPMTASTYRLLVERPEEVLHRGQAVPMRNCTAAMVQYVFNYSMVAPLRRTDATRRMLSMLAQQLEDAPRAGRCAIVVSEDGARVARRLGMHELAELQIAGSIERVFGTRPGETGT